MSSVEIRTEVHKLIDRLDDSFLKVVHSMLDTYVQEQEKEQIVGYDIDGNPLYANEAKEEYLKRVSAMKSGQSTSIEDLKKEASKW